MIQDHISVCKITGKNYTALLIESLKEVPPHDTNALVFDKIDSIKTACRLAGVRDFRVPDCRHTTSRMTASGSPHSKVMKITLLRTPFKANLYTDKKISDLLGIGKV
jgi:hypothetical protein